MQDAKIDIRSMLPEELEVLMAELGEPGYRAKQLFSWLSNGGDSFEEMTNLPKGLREKLSTRCTLRPLNMLRKQVSALDGTIKYLWQLEDGNVHIGDNDLLKAHLLNCAIKMSTERGRGKLVKLSPSLHIDGAAALIDAMTMRSKYFAEIGEQLKNED